MELKKKKKEINLHWQLVNLSPVKVKRFYSGAQVTQCEAVSKTSKMIFSAASQSYHMTLEVITSTEFLL